MPMRRVPIPPTSFSLPSLEARLRHSKRTVPASPRPSGDARVPTCVAREASLVEPATGIGKSAWATTRLTGTARSRREISLIHASMQAPGSRLAPRASGSQPSRQAGDALARPMRLSRGRCFTKSVKNFNARRVFRAIANRENAQVPLRGTAAANALGSSLRPCPSRSHRPRVKPCPPRIWRPMHR